MIKATGAQPSYDRRARGYHICVPQDSKLYVDVPTGDHLVNLLLNSQFRGAAHFRRRAVAHLILVAGSLSSLDRWLYTESNRFGTQRILTFPEVKRFEMPWLLSSLWMVCMRTRRRLTDTTLKKVMPQSVSG